MAIGSVPGDQHRPAKQSEAELHNSGSQISIERIASLIARGALVALGCKWKSPARIFALLGGSTLLYWGATARPLASFLPGGRLQTKSGIASVRHNRAIRVESSIIVGGPVEKICRIWRNPENLPFFIDDIKSVRPISDTRSHWIVKGPAGKEIEWESEIYNEKQNEFFAWRSMLNADVNHAEGCLSNCRCKQLYPVRPRIAADPRHMPLNDRGLL
jgi:uncharacterized membrane protein